MTIVDVIQTVADNGGAAVSSKGTRLTTADLAPITKLGKHAVSYRTVPLTESEIKGEWTYEADGI